MQDLALYSPHFPSFPDHSHSDDCRSGLARVLFLLLLVVLIPLNARSESLVVYGVQLKVDSLTLLPGNMARVSLFGSERIVSREELPSYVLESYLEHGSTDLKTGDWQAIFRNAAESGDLKQAADVLVYLLSDRTGDASSIEHLLLSVKDERQATVIAKNALQEAAGKPIVPSLVPPLFFKAGMQDPEWMRGAGLKVLYRSFNETKTYLRAKFVQQLSNTNLDKAKEVLALILTLFGDSDSDAKSLQALLSRVQTIRSALDSGNINDVLSVLSAGEPAPSTDQEMRLVVSQIALNEAARLLREKNYGGILLVLSRIGTSLRTPRAHELVREALGDLSPNDLDILGNSDVKAMLVGYSGNDEALKGIYISRLEERIKRMLKAGNVSDTEDVLKNILLLRPDPNSSNDAIRIRQTKRYLRQGSDSRAVEKLLAVKTGIPLLDRAWFGLFRLVFRTSVWFYLLLLVCVGGFLGYFLLSGRKVRKREAVWRTLGWEEGLYDRGRDLARPFVSSELRPGIDPVFREYFECLELLGLKPGATPKDVKTAYRKKMKEVHPDLHSGEEEESSKRFIRIRKAYERLLQLEIDGVPMTFRMP